MELPFESLAPPVLQDQRSSIQNYIQGDIQIIYWIKPDNSIYIGLYREIYRLFTGLNQINQFI